MIFDYATPSAFESTRERAMLGLAVNRRRPVRFRAKVRREHRLHFRVALSALAEVIWSADEWIDESSFRSFILDPIITVHPDVVIFEGFSQDQASYAQVRFDRAIFEPEGAVETGTTNVDFTAWFRAAFDELRSSRETILSVSPEGFEVQTQGAGGRFERKVDVPDPWITAFLALQSAMRTPGTRLRARPVDVLAAIRFLAALKAKVSPRALRFELDPGKDARLVLEPWEHVVPLVGADHTYSDGRVVRIWGRRRLKLLEPLLPYADEVEVYLKGRALPHFWQVSMPGVRFLLGLSGWSENRFSRAGGIALLSGSSNEPPPGVERVLERLRERVHAPLAALGEGASAAVDHLVRAGRALWDLEAREARHRELFDEPIVLERYFPPDPQLIASRGLAVELRSVAPRETRKLKRLKTPEGPSFREVVYRDYQVFGAAGPEREVEVVTSEAGRLIFGRCGCAHFRENHLGRGPCAHMLALLAASEGARRDLPSSEAAAAPPPRVDSGPGEEEEDE